MIALNKTIVAKPRLTAIILGLISATGFPPLSLWPISLLALAGFVLLVIHTPGWRKAMLLGWLFGFAQFSLANNWIATAFAYQSNMPPILGWLAVPIMCIYLAIYPAIAAGAARALAGREHPIAFIFAFSGCWIVTEWLRSWVFTGYPWPPLGLMMLGGFDQPGLAMLLPWTGTYAFSGVVLLVAGLLGWTIHARRWTMLAPLVLLVSAMMLWPAGPGREGTLAYTVVQPNIQQKDMNNPALYESRFRKTSALSRRREDDPAGPRIVLWPESALPDFLEDGYPPVYYAASTAGGDPGFARQRLGETIGEGSLLLTGLGEIEFADGQPVGARNAVGVIDSSGTVVDSYYKAHLVPYGEYLALRWLLEPLGARRLVPGSLDFWPGPGPQTLDLGPWGQAGVQICYEIIFSGKIVDPDKRPDYIFNPSNDGWYGSWGPPQYFAQARLRAIEEGLPVLRSTTTGISGVIDARGVVRHAAGRNQAARIDGFVPPAHEPTLFARLGNWLAIIWMVAFLITSLVASRSPRR